MGASLELSSFNAHGVEDIAMIILSARENCIPLVHSGRERSLEKEASVAAGVLTGHEQKISAPCSLCNLTILP